MLPRAKCGYTKDSPKGIPSEPWKSPEVFDDLLTPALSIALL